MMPTTARQLLTVALALVLCVSVGAQEPVPGDPRAQDLEAEISELREREAELVAELEEVRRRASELERRSEEQLRVATKPIAVTRLKRQARVYSAPSMQSGTSRRIPKGAVVGVHGKVQGNAFKFVEVSYDGQLGLVQVSALEEEPLAGLLEQYASELNEAEKAEKAVREAAAKARRDERLARYTKKYGSENGKRIAERKIWIGMTSLMAQDSWGAPKDINRTVTAGGVREQWVYPFGSYLYFDDGVLTSWQD